MEPSRDEGKVLYVALPTNLRGYLNCAGILMAGFLAMNPATASSPALTTFWTPTRYFCWLNYTVVSTAASSLTPWAKATVPKAVIEPLATAKATSGTASLIIASNLCVASLKPCTCAGAVAFPRQNSQRHGKGRGQRRHADCSHRPPRTPPGTGGMGSRPRPRASCCSLPWQDRRWSMGYELLVALSLSPGKIGD